MAGYFEEDGPPRGMAEQVILTPARMRLLETADELKRQIAQGHGVAARDRALELVNSLCEEFQVDPFV